MKTQTGSLFILLLAVIHLECTPILANKGAATRPVFTGEEEFTVLPKQIDGVALHEMMSKYLLRHVDEAWERWQQEYEQRTTPEAIEAYQQDRRQRFIEAIGGFPDRTPLNAKTTGIIERDGYRVEKVVFESQPNHYVTAVLFLPDAARFAAPYPGVLIPCGHSADGKAHLEYQTMGASLALHGMAALVFDPIDQGERGQLLDDTGKPPIWGTKAHAMVGVGSILLGRNTATFEIYDGMRALDYLQSRPEVDADRIGCTGNSGGGTQTSYLMALDDRIIAAAPSCYLNRQGRQLRTATGDAEQNIFGQLTFGMDHADFLMMRAPVPILICAATKDFFDINGTWQSFRYAKRLYTRMGVSERISLMENDEKHNYNKLQREAAARWLARWLLGRDQPPINEPPIVALNDTEILCTPRGQVMLLEGARSVYDLNEDCENELAEQRRKLWSGTDRAELLEQVRRIAGVRKRADLPPPEIDHAGEVRLRGCRVKKLVLQPEDGICLPALMFVPKRSAGLPVLYIDEAGKTKSAAPGGRIEELVRAGRTVLAVDLRGTGETRQTRQNKFGLDIGLDWEDFYKAYVLGRSYVGMRAEDLLVAARYAAQETSAAQVELVAVGNVGVPALHAAALEPDLFASVKLVGTLKSWSNVIRSHMTRNQLANVVHGALRTYDLPDLAATLGRKLTIEHPVDALEQE